MGRRLTRAGGRAYARTRGAHMTWTTLGCWNIGFRSDSLKGWVEVDVWKLDLDTLKTDYLVKSKRFPDKGCAWRWAVREGYVVPKFQAPPLPLRPDVDSVPNRAKRGRCLVCGNKARKGYIYCRPCARNLPVLP